MGVAGSGKSTVGKALARRLGWPFYDADDLHPPTNIEKMEDGRALDDRDRKSWITTLENLLKEETARSQSLVLAWSALRRVHRERLIGESPRVLLVHLSGSPTLLSERLAERSDHFFPPALLASQLRDLELPGEALTLDCALPVEEMLQRIVRELEIRR